jgi:chromosome partitioning protein
MARCRVFAVVNQKGGVGKTTTAVNLAASFAASERATLLIDLDPQANATSAFGMGPVARHVYDALIGRCVMKDVTVPTELRTLQLVPSGRDLYGAEIELVTAANRERCLELALADLKDRYEAVIIDCPPSLGLLTLNALGAADSVLIPLQCEYYALEGLAGLLETVEQVRERFNPDLHLEGIVLTMSDPRNNLSRQVEEEVRNHFGDRVFATRIPRNVRLSEAPSHGKPILLYDVHSKGAVSYLQLAQEILRRFDRQPGVSPCLPSVPPIASIPDRRPEPPAQAGLSQAPRDAVPPGAGDDDADGTTRSPGGSDEQSA